VSIEAAEDAGSSSSYEGRLPPLVQIAWHYNGKTRALKEFFLRSRGALTVSEAQCVTHKLDISQFLIPGFQPAFLEVLRILEQQDTETKQYRAFRKFVRDYGTHYLSSVFLGSKIAALTYFTSNERLKLNKRKVMRCSESAAKKALNVKVSSTDKKDEEGKEEDDDGCYGKDDPLPLGVEFRTEVSEFGTRPDDNSELKSWKDKAQKKPIPIKFELTPIVNLFNQENLDDRHNISSSKITKWFLPLYIKYCKVLKLDCSVDTGCGLSDSCGFSQNCVKDRQSSKGYRCYESSWADVPNWPTFEKTGYSAAAADKPDDGDKTADKPNRRSDTVGGAASLPVPDPDATNITWFRATDFDRSGGLSRSELIAGHNTDSWYDQRFRIAAETLIQEADQDGNRIIDLNEFVRLHERQPWYSEQLSFLLVNIDNNGYLSREELLEAAKVSPDMQLLNFSFRQLENLVDGLLAIGDKDLNGRLSFAEFVDMSNDVFVINFAPSSLKRIFKG